MSIRSQIDFLKDKLSDDVKIVAVSKFHSAECIAEAYRAGLRIFGENRAQELIAKRKVLPDDIEWHFIGPLQTNKVKDIAPFVHTIQSVDSLKLLQEIDRQAAKQSRIIRILLEIRIAEEESKHGFIPEKCEKILANENVIANFPNIRIGGLMGMATFTEDEEQIRKEFRLLHDLFKDYKSSFFEKCDHFTELSMGMTGDYEIAISEGSTMVRIGSLIFGDRNLCK
ncbi:MAG: YggS family pyridoxal phosphate-dependent enzyme [Tannerellaceae bacterium]|jgi:pyridoxal phosphate enzyme (YggS family)|nr:YggS family pyridoxal phosphate-dependent enzyme [Tannerellaceae bacterium]